MSKPHLFIGSSDKEIKPARCMVDVLNDDMSMVLAKTWKDGGAFEGTRSTLESLLDQLEVCEFGAFILAPDDVVSSQGTQSHRTRDNVVFELGLFLGRFGPERTFILRRRDPRLSTRPPSDLFGINLISFEFDETAAHASVASACNRIRMAVESVLTAAKPPIRAASVITQLELELSERKYAPVSLQVDRSSSTKVSFNFANPTRAEVKLLHICFPPELDMNFLPWVSRYKEQQDPRAPNLRYFWLTNDQLQNVERPHGFKFLLHGRAKGTYEIKIVATIGSKTIVQPVTVDVA